MVFHLCQLERSQRVSREIQLFPHGHVDHAQYRNPFLHKGDINRKFAVFLDKLFGTVQRVHDPQRLPFGALLERDLLSFLA